MMKTRSFLARLCRFLIIGAVLFNPGPSQAKAGDDQDQIILLNDSASALEDSNPGLSKSLAQFADEKEKQWEYNTANKVVLPAVITDKDIPRLQEQIKLLNAAAIAIKPTYPLIAQGLIKMEKDINRTIEKST
jgi:hypothetical protein